MVSDTKSGTTPFNTMVDISSLQKKHGANILIDQGFMLTRCHAFNLIISGGRGLPRRQIIEFHGPEGCGKSTVVYEILGIATNHYGYVVVLADEETPVDDQRLQKFGLVRGKNLIYIHEPSVEEVFQKADKVIADAKKDFPGIPIIFAIDSVNGVPPYAHTQIKKYTDDPKIGAMAKAWGDMVRQWISKYFFDDITLILTNHLTEKINAGPFGKKTMTPGGRVLKYLQTIRIEMVRVGTIKNHLNFPVGIQLKIEAVKNKFSPPFQKIRVPLFFGNPDLPPEKDFAGTWDDLACLWFLQDRSHIKTAGGWSKLELLDMSTGEAQEIKFHGETDWVRTVMPEHRQLVYEAMRQAQFNPDFFKPQS